MRTTKNITHFSLCHSYRLKFVLREREREFHFPLSPSLFIFFPSFQGNVVFQKLYACLGKGEKVDKHDTKCILGSIDVYALFKKSMIISKQSVCKTRPVNSRFKIAVKLLLLFLWLFWLFWLLWHCKHVRFKQIFMCNRCCTNYFIRSQTKSLVVK